MTNRLASIGVTICGIILAAVPLALWVAWTPLGFLCVLAVGFVSVIVFGVLLSRSPHNGDESAGRSRDDIRAALPDAFVEEIHGIFPLNYHHSTIEKARFRRTMARLRRMIR